MGNSASDSGTPAKTGAVMVLYNPDWSLTDKAIKAISQQVDTLCLVDNSDSDSNARFRDMDCIVYLPLHANRGIAAAQNAGIRELIARGVDLIFFIDQDSVAGSDVVLKLTEACSLLQDHGVRIAALGTRAINSQTGLPYAPKSLELGSPKELVGSGMAGSINETYSVISSISMIPTEAFLEVGGFDEALFIDGVDHEWCWRAWHSHKRRTFIVESAHISHMLGEGDRRIASHKISIPATFRLYYQFRNYLWLRRRDYVPSFWLRKNGRKYIIKAFYFPIMVAPRLSNLRNIVRGLRDGLRPKGPTSRWPRFD